MKLSKNDEKWLMKCGLLGEFVEKYGRLPRREDSYKNVALGVWVKSQLDKYRDGTLSDAQVDMLRALGMDFSKLSHKDQWEKMFELLQKYVKENGILPRFDAVYEGEYLGRWVAYQKTRNKDGRLLSERKALLEGIGIDFGRDALEAKRQLWAERERLLEKYLSVHLALPVRDAMVDGFAVGKWLRDSVAAYTCGQLSELRWNSLSALAERYGFDLMDVNWRKLGFKK